MYGAAMHNSPMPNRYVIANIHRRFLVGAMYNGAVLYVYFVSYAYIMHIAPYYGIKPNTALVAHANLAYYGGIIGQKTLLAKNRPIAIYTQDKCHKKEKLKKVLKNVVQTFFIWRKEKLYLNLY